MKSHPAPPQLGGQPGVALIIVISLIAMLTAVTVALVVIIDHSSQQTAGDLAARQSEALAQSAFETVLGDLADEMEKGSSEVVVHDLEDGTTYRQFDVTDQRGGLRVTPALQDGASEAGVLIKQSQPQKPFHTWPNAAASRASEVSTASGSAPLPPQLWDRPQLLGEDELFDTSNSPTWVYVARDGTNPATFAKDMLPQKLEDQKINPDFVVGRYAYNLYETSGLLDINVAGFPSSNGPSQARIGQKGSLVFADLTAIPGFTASSIDKLARWRHQWKTDPQEYIRLSEGTGWQRMAANDNLFLGRQDLLSFAQLYPDALPQEALPFLTHFSRDLDAPSHRPDPNRSRIARNAAAGGNDAYRADDEVNPDLTGFDAERQQQLLPRRFPLERLKWVVTPNGSGPVDADKAERYFGLRWQDTYWEYVHARANGDLYTLQDVPADREPNFFEILRATVLAGSLGRQYASRGHDDLDQRLSMHQLGGVDGSVNLNIMEMGACIIDQYDEDSYPTGIMLKGPARPYYAFGKEDVPYLVKLSAMPYRGRVLPEVVVYNNDGKRADTEAYEGTTVLQPTLWRPHQEAENYIGPTRFRIRPQHVDLGGGSQFYMVNGWNVPGKTGKPAPNPPRSEQGNYSYWGGPNYRLTHPELFPKTFAGDEYIDVEIPDGSTAFREPQSVHSPAHGEIAGYELGGNTEPVEVRDGDLRSVGLPTSYKEVSGFVVGYALTARIEPGSNSSNRLGVGYLRGDPVEVQLEYQAADGQWRPYHRAEFTYKSNWGDHYLRPTPLWETDAFHWSSYLVDPRTARFGGLATVLACGMKTGEWSTALSGGRAHWPEGASLGYGKQRTVGVRPGWTGPASNTGWSYNDSIGWSEAYNHAGIAENNAVAWSDTLTFAYKDPDDVQREGVAAGNEHHRSIFVGNPMSSRYEISKEGKLTPAESMAGRPQILNRPFRSVAELAYSFRGTPWRDIDFLHATSADAGLLDVFSLYEDPDEEKMSADALSIRPAPVVAGRVNLNAAPPEVLSALLSGVSREEDNVITAEEAPVLARTLVRAIRSQSGSEGPLLSKAELVSRPTGTNAKATSLTTSISDKFQKPEDRSINDRREAVTRALADGTTLRSWNFTLDLIAQSGRFPPTSSSLEDFQPNAERRYWIHFAVDRLSGRLLDVQWELVTY